MARERTFLLLLEEAHPEQPFFQTHWARGEHLGQALERALAAARAQGFTRPICREAGPYDLDRLDCEVEPSPRSEVFRAIARQYFPPEPAFTLPPGVLAASEPPEGAADAGDIQAGYRVLDRGGYFSVEVNADASELLGLYARMLRAFEPFRVFWYKVHGHWSGDESAPDAVFVNEALDSADRILAHLAESPRDGLENGFLTLTAYAREGATNVNISDHKKVVVLTTLPAQRDRALAVLEQAGLRALDPLVTIDEQVAHWHYRHPESRDREALIEHLKQAGFTPWSPGS